jgi:hypothetical protein
MKRSEKRQKEAKTAIIYASKQNEAKQVFFRLFSHLKMK